MEWPANSFSIDGMLTMQLHDLAALISTSRETWDGEKISRCIFWLAHRTAT
jgi:hypothetical protein